LGDVEAIMRTILGMIVGCLLTIGAAYIHDAAAPSTTAGTSEKLVNWDVAAREWGYIKATAHTAWEKAQTIDVRPSKSGAG
jgi:hypothetical protein